MLLHNFLSTQNSRYHSWPRINHWVTFYIFIRTHIHAFIDWCFNQNLKTKIVTRSIARHKLGLRETMYIGISIESLHSHSFQVSRSILSLSDLSLIHSEYKTFIIHVLTRAYCAASAQHNYNIVAIFYFYIQPLRIAICNIDFIIMFAVSIEKCTIYQLIIMPTTINTHRKRPTLCFYRIIRSILLSTRARCTILRRTIRQPTVHHFCKSYI